MKYDLHSHTTASDGELSPNALIARARNGDVDVLAITDHDTLAAYREIDRSALGALTLIPGTELSSQWQKNNVHIVGLNVPLECGAFADAIASQQRSRIERASIIADKLAKKGFTDILPGVLEKAGKGSIGRPHFAQQLLEIGAVKSLEEAFKKYLGTGKIGDVKQIWPQLDEVVGWIRDAGGTAVLAHPDKYRLTRSKLHRLTDDFISAGGEAIEVVSGKQDKVRTRELAKLCIEKNLLASCGSDFHQPGKFWAELGQHSPLPEECTPVWDRW